MTPAPRPSARLGAPAGVATVIVALGGLAALSVVRPVAPLPFVLLCAAAALVGLVAIAVRIAPAWLLSLGIVVAPMAGNWELVGLPGTLAPDRVLLLGGVIATLARVPAVRDLPEPRVRASHWIFAVYLAYGLGSAVVVGSIFSDTVFQLERLGLTALGCFLVAPVAFARPEDRRILLWCLTGLGAYLGVLAIVEIVAPALVFPAFIADPGIARHLGRARGPFLEAELNGFAMFASLLAALILRSGSVSVRERRVAVAVVALCALGILLTLTRTTWLGAVAGGLAALIATPSLRRYLLPSVAAGVVMVLAALALIPGLAASVTDRASNQHTVWDRQNLNRAAVNMVLDKPLTGHGWNRFSAVANDYFWQADTYPLGVAKAKVGAHNLPLAIASELGLIGVTLWAAGMIAAFWEGLTGRIPPSVRPWRIALIALVVHYVVLVLVTPARHPVIALFLLVWAAIAAGPRSLQPGTGRPA